MIKQLIQDDRVKLNIHFIRVIALLKSLNMLSALSVLNVLSVLNIAINDTY
jgi:hypothetical protein